MHPTGFPGIYLKWTGFCLVSEVKLQFFTSGFVGENHKHNIAN